MLALSGLRGLIVIDEVHLLPDLFRTLRVLGDDPAARRRFLVLGSAVPELLRQGAETMAGRIAYHELSGFRPDEVGFPQLSKRWVSGGFPRSFLASNDIASDEWREQFIRSFLERDIPLFGVTHTTVQRYPDVLTETFMVRQLPPWHENLSNRQVCAPKVYLRDTGLPHMLLGVRNLRDLQAHPEVGASWEGFVIAVGHAVDAFGPH